MTGRRSEHTGLGLRSLYFLIFLFLGGLGNYFPLWLEDAGWTSPMIGWLTGVRYLTIIIFPIIWGRLADKKGDPVGVTRLLTTTACIMFIPILFSAEFIVVLIAMALFSAFRMGTIPLTDTMTLRFAEETGGDYGRFRLWGSVGFILGGFTLAYIISNSSRDSIPIALECMLVLTATVAWLLPRHSAAMPSASPPSVRGILANVDFRRFLMVTLLWRVCGQGIYLFLPIHLNDLGVSDNLLPSYWAVGVLSEIILLRWAPQIFSGWSHRAKLIFCLGACSIQYAWMGLIESPLWLYAAMTLHGLTFGIAYYTCVLWLNERIPEGSRTTAQAVFQSVSFGIGGAISAIVAGYLFAMGRGPYLLLAASAASAITVVFAAFLLKRYECGDKDAPSCQT